MDEVILVSFFLKNLCIAALRNYFLRKNEDKRIRPKCSSYCFVVTKCQTKNPKPKTIDHSTMKKFSGTGVAIVTPFAGGEVDFPALGKVIEHVIAGGVDYVVSLGSTGESSTLFPEEHKEILRFTAQKTNGRIPLVAGVFGANSTGHLLKRLEEYADALDGFDALMASSPAYVKPTQEGIFQHYWHLKNMRPCPSSSIMYRAARPAMFQPKQPSAWHMPAKSSSPSKKPPATCTKFNKSSKTDLTTSSYSPATTPLLWRCWAAGQTGSSPS